MSTSVINRTYLKTALVYLGVTIFVAFFGAVYELFSHGVYSYCMLYAFAFPLVGGVLPFFLLGLWGNAPSLRHRIKTPTALARKLHHAGIATLTVGSIICGVLEIYGTTSYLTKYYWIVGGLLLVAAVACTLLGIKGKVSSDGEY